MATSSSSRQRLACGPADPSELYLQREHVSRNVWAGVETEAVRCRRYEGIIWDVPIHPRVLDIVDEMGFGGILRCGQPKDLDHHLITALIERWRPETHTFHFPVGEATVTLEDVEVLWGLKVDGDALTGGAPTNNGGYWMQASLDYLGFTPSPAEIKALAWKSTSLSGQLRIELGDEEPDYIYMQRARVYCLLLIGGLMLPNATGNKIYFFYLQFLMDVQASSRYSWGGATLATLYHNLCEAALGKRTDVAGPLTLLQMWAWERIPNIRPIMTSPPEFVDYVPCAVTWCGPLSHIKAPQHCTEHYRDQFSRMHANQFIWKPYLTRNLPAICEAGRPIWMSMTCLICWNLVEPHMPQRVLRQFGIVQPYVPLEARFHPQDFVKQDRRGKSSRNWETYHAAHIQKWDNRHDLVWTDFDFSDEPIATNDYMNWFRRSTVVYLTQPGVHAEEGIHEVASSHSYAVETLQRIRHYLRGRDTMSQPDVAELSQMVEDGLQVCGEPEAMDSEPAYRSQVDVNLPVREKARRRAQKNKSGAASSSQAEFEWPSPPRAMSQSRHSVSHTGGTGEDIGPSTDSQTPQQSRVRDDFFGVDMENMVVEETPQSTRPRKGWRGLFVRKRTDG